MKRIIGYTDSITECECCGKTGLKGTYCIELNGVELYYGSVCAFKSHSLDSEQQKELVNDFKRKKKLSEKFSALEVDFHKNDYMKVKLLRFTQSNNMDMKEFCKKYGKVVDENIHAIWYTFGHVCVSVDK